MTEIVLHAPGGVWPPTGGATQGSVEIVRSLLKATRPIAVRITLKQVSEGRLALLRQAGLNVEPHDEDAVLFAMDDQRTLKAIGNLDFVTRIAPL